MNSLKAITSTKSQTKKSRRNPFRQHFEYYLIKLKTYLKVWIYFKMYKQNNHWISSLIWQKCYFEEWVANDSFEFSIWTGWHWTSTLKTQGGIVFVACLKARTTPWFVISTTNNIWKIETLPFLGWGDCEKFIIFWVFFFVERSFQGWTRLILKRENLEIQPSLNIEFFLPDSDQQSLQQQSVDMLYQRRKRHQEMIR